MKKKIYVASSWRNENQPMVVNFLRSNGFDVYDFKNPYGNPGFQWTNIDQNWQDWTPEEFREGLKTKEAQFGFNRDFDAMKAADACVLLLPCGRSAHLEAGYMKGAGKRVIAYNNTEHMSIEPELMYNLLDGIALNRSELLQMLLKP